jgi:hypothetical protein
MLKVSLSSLMSILWLVNPIMAQTSKSSAATPPRMGVLFDAASLAKIPVRKVEREKGANPNPKSKSLKGFAPPVLNQGDLSTCVASAFAVALTIQEAKQRNWTNPADIQKLLFSPAYLYAASKAVEDTECKRGLFISKIIEGIKEYGLVRHSVIGETCLQQIDPQLAKNAFRKGLPELSRFELSKAEIRRAIAEGNPVVVAVGGEVLGKSFFDLRTDLWKVEEPASSSSSTGHAMLIVGYDINKYGGAFEIMNSYGNEWGANGFAWVKYDDLFENNSIKFAIEVPPLTELPALDTARNAPPIPAPAVVNKFEGRLHLIDKKGVTIEVIAAELAPKEKGAAVRVKTANSHFFAKQPVTEGYDYQIVVKNTEPGYVYIFNYDSRNVVDILFPHDTVSARMGVKDKIVLPSDNTVITFDGNKGRDYACVLFSKTPLDMPKIKTQLQNLPSGNFLERLEQVFGEQLASAKAGQVRYGIVENDLKLETSSDKTIMPLIIEFEHL